MKPLFNLGFSVLPYLCGLWKTTNQRIMTKTSLTPYRIDVWDSCLIWMAWENYEQKATLQKSIKSKCDIYNYQIGNSSGLVINLGWITTEYVHPLLHGTLEEEEKTNQTKIKEDYWTKTTKLGGFYIVYLLIWSSWWRAANLGICSAPTALGRLFYPSKHAANTVPRFLRSHPKGPPLCSNMIYQINTAIVIKI